MTEAHNFQSIIIKLQKYWAQRGCLIWQPYYTQVGAGTMNPATALRVLGPEPWKVAYVEPSIRPDDARYGENPNRLQMHYQFQVILKPDPGNPQELYLDSLQALGIDPGLHDIRFVEDNWESPALGAWGLGWEVWLDGQEITQFTYFQQAGGQVLDPVSVEMTYGLERIAIALQRVGSFREIQWSPSLTDGDVNLQAEQEHSQYYIEVADVERLSQMFNLYEQEAKACLERELVLPAHDYVLKCSHTFNVLDTRGAIGVTQRQAYFARMRDLSRSVAEAYVEQRQRLGFPWGNVSSIALGEKTTPKVSEIPTKDTDQPADFLLEIGTEELPADDLKNALIDLELLFKTEITGIYHFIYKNLRVFGTPRRLVIYIEDLLPKTENILEEVAGPPVLKSFDQEGKPTETLIGWARSKGFSVEDIDETWIKEKNGKKYVSFSISKEGESVINLLAWVLPAFHNKIRFDKSMRWNISNVAFSRPIRWLLALYGDQVVSFEFAGLSSANITRGLRFNQPLELEVKDSQDYFQVISQQGIILDVVERKKYIEGKILELSKEVGGSDSIDPDLLDEVTNLVEAPVVLRGSFDVSHLQLPNEVLIAVMKKHQRYFPVAQNGKLLPYFVFVANKPALAQTQAGQVTEDQSVIIEGNEHVIKARFADAAYFVHEDEKHDLEEFVPRLDNLTFQVELGSMLDKTRRLEKLVIDFARVLNFPAKVTKTAHRAASLCKADLATQMVIEMTSLQGVMGRYYALRSGENPEVAQAILEHYLPRFTGDDVPKNRAGFLVGLADRLDTLMGFFAAGLSPTGAKDPFAQRRSALGLVQNLIAWNIDFNLQGGLEIAASYLPITASSENQKSCLLFIFERLRNLMLDQQYRYDVVDAVLAAQGHNPARSVAAIKALSKWVARPDWNDILPAYARCVRITRVFEQTFTVNPRLFLEDAETDLFQTVTRAEAIQRRPGSVDDFLNAFLPIIPAINQYFDRVLVMVDDEDQCQNRLGLLQRIVALAADVADMSKLEGF